MLTGDYAKLAIFTLVVLQTACSQNRIPNIVSTEEGMICECRYLDTISEVSDPGKIAFLSKYISPYDDGERKVLERASAMGGSHLVWIYNYPIGSSASIYRCPD